MGPGNVIKDSPMPNEVSGLSAWFDASSASHMSTSTTSDSAPSDNADVARWKDLSGNGYDAVSFTSSSSKPKFDRWV